MATQKPDRTEATAAIREIRNSIALYRLLAGEVGAQLTATLQTSKAAIARSRQLLDRIEQNAATSWPFSQIE